jgi:hypothetical protein
MGQKAEGEVRRGFCQNEPNSISAKHGIRAKRSKSGAVSFDLVEMEVSHASLQ